MCDYCVLYKAYILLYVKCILLFFQDMDSLLLTVMDVLNFILFASDTRELFCYAN